MTFVYFFAKSRLENDLIDFSIIRLACTSPQNNFAAKKSKSRAMRTRLVKGHIYISATVRPKMKFNLAWLFKHHHEEEEKEEEAKEN